MKNLLATTALAVIATTGAASAQSVLERVLSEIDNSTNLERVNGTFANIAENIGGTAVVYVDGNGGSISQSVYNAGLDAALKVVSDKAITLDGSDYVYDGDVYATEAEAEDAKRADYAEASLAYSEGFTRTEIAGGGIDGSITNIVVGITEATQNATVTGTGGVAAIEWDMPDLSFGDMKTTALGAVNTGDITLGVNSTVEEAKTTSTQAVASVMDQLGGSAETGVVVLNIASNMTGIDGSIANTMSSVNGTIGDAATTALGAVNTGTIVSGVNAAVTGIVGKSGQTNGFAPAEPET